MAVLINFWLRISLSLPDSQYHQVFVLKGKHHPGKYCFIYFYPCEPCLDLSLGIHEAETKFVRAFHWCFTMGCQPYQGFFFCLASLYSCSLSLQQILELCVLVFLYFSWKKLARSAKSLNNDIKLCYCLSIRSFCIQNTADCVSNGIIKGH